MNARIADWLRVTQRTTQVRRDPASNRTPPKQQRRIRSVEERTSRAALEAGKVAPSVVAFMHARRGQWLPAEPIIEGVGQYTIGVRAALAQLTIEGKLERRQLPGRGGRSEWRSNG